MLKCDLQTVPVPSHDPAVRLPRGAQVLILAAILYLSCPPHGQGEEFLDIKAMYYQEDNSRMNIFAPAFYYQKDFSPTLSLRIDGIYNTISGATPTGAPPQPKTTVTYVQQAVSTSIPSGGGEPEEEDKGEDKEHDLRKTRRHGFHARAGATPTAPSGGGTATVQEQVITETGGESVPMADVEDERVGLNLAIVKKVDDHSISATLSFSTEHDYDSMGVALSDGIGFHDGCTVLSLGAAYTFDTINIASQDNSHSKETTDILVGLTQILDPKTILTANVSMGFIEGYLADPYKVVELNGALVPEVRPDSKTKHIFYLSLTHLFGPVNGSVEGSYRLYDDSFGVTGQTAGLAWLQQIGSQFVLKPMLRYYAQTAADFYAVRFTGAPEHYSSDYRVSELTSLGLGLKVVFRPSRHFAMDVAYERYAQRGQDGVTHDDAYPSANVITAGTRIDFW